ncbi:helix-turn-helix domain-containing protein [Priestia flexa]|uniref:helix-turn-helix domain-containing protein n=1 Tax=Priestia flexa TaxID=86664 RepID=UPI00077C38AF|nr:helix-turn-helix domain-containing protein [Priestia flexa]MED4590500.1 helix-turn-helix domain-containing protein [Priestia flexa]
MKSIGEKIKERRKELGLTQNDLSGPTLSHAMISLVERNQTKPSLKTLEFIAGKLGVTVSYLMEDEDEESVDSNNIQREINTLEAFIKNSKITEAENLISNLKNKELPIEFKGIFLKLSSEVEVIKKNYNEAIKMLDQSLYYITPNDLNKYIEIYYGLSFCYMQVKDYQQSIKNSLYSLLFFDSNFCSENPVLQLKLYYNLAYCYCKEAKFNEGLNIIQKALDLMKSTDIYHQQGLFYMLQGLAQLYLKQYNTAIESNNIALKNLKEIKLVVGCLSNQGILFREVENFSASEDYLKKSIELANDHKLYHYSQNSKYELALTYIITGKLDEAQKICREQLISSQEVSELNIKFTLILANIKLKHGLLSESLIYANDAETKAQEINNDLLIAKAYSIRVKILESQGSYKEANLLLNKILNNIQNNSHSLYNSLDII